jgi:hypothetical protein
MTRPVPDGRGERSGGAWKPAVDRVRIPLTMPQAPRSKAARLLRAAGLLDVRPAEVATLNTNAGINT